MKKSNTMKRFSTLVFRFVNDNKSSNHSRSWYRVYDIVADGLKIGEVRDYYNDYKVHYIDGEIYSAEDLSAFCAISEARAFSFGGTTVRFSDEYFRANVEKQEVNPAHVPANMGRPASAYRV